MKCPNCKAENIPNAQFCENCGSKILKAKKEKNKRNMILASAVVILALFIGISILISSSTAISCPQCGSTSLTDDHENKLFCTQCKSPITCPKCNEQLYHGRNVYASDGTVHYYANCKKCGLEKEIKEFEINYNYYM